MRRRSDSVQRNETAHTSLRFDSLRALHREISAADCSSSNTPHPALGIPHFHRRLRDAQSALDSAVRAAYGMTETEDPLAFLLQLNLDLAAKEAKGQPITPPGLPVGQPGEALTTADC